MNVGDIIYPFFEHENHTLGLVLGLSKTSWGSARARVLIHGNVYSVPLHQVREVK